MSSGSNFALASRPGSIQPALSLPLEMHALYHCADIFFLEKNMLVEPGQEFVSHVLPYWEYAEPDSSLRLAMTAYSNAVFGRSKGVRSALCLAEKAYMKTVEQTLEEMKTLSANKIYQVVLAMMLMGSYENVMFSLRTPLSSPPDEVGSRFWRSVCHEKGAAALLSVRRERGLAANVALEKVIRQKCLRLLILQGANMPDWLKDGTSWGEEGPELELDSLMIRVLILRHKSVALFREIDAAEPHTIEKAKTMAIEADALDRDLMEWPSTLPRNWNFEIAPAQLQSPPTTNAPAKFPRHLYASVGLASVWNRHRALRLVTNRIHQRSLLSLQSVLKSDSLSTNLRKCQENINALAGEMCGGVQFQVDPRSFTKDPQADIVEDSMTTLDVLHPGVAGSLAWPLTIAVSIESVPHLERSWLKAALRAVARILGHTLLESVTDRGEFRF
ncbi:hypothetical protein N7508_004588 [Penicillium antarcticum]|uniref:uncharacterized protein n=1 Tax=Penicillium antarcticum TaxID=416450 RepID=UPI0023962C1D|nr:uncharacterized protein N7508_004588 [Penicillium antarcticum]KAJ5309209.1 hypothetical protein N7508_004588 [Penicillium antarcticum]